MFLAAKVNKFFDTKKKRKNMYAPLWGKEKDETVEI